MSVALVSSLLLAGAALPAADRAAIAARVAEIFRPYATPEGQPLAWDAPVFAAETAALIAHWQRVRPEGEVDGLSDGDWFCLCQDFDPKAFRARPGAIRPLRPGVVAVTVALDLGFGAKRAETLVLVREAGAWRLDDLRADPDFPRGLKQKLRETIAADEAL